MKTHLFKQTRLCKSMLTVAVGSALALSAGIASAAAPGAMTAGGVPIPNGAVMLVWAGDGVSLPWPIELGRDGDFLAVIDAEPRSKTYSSVIWTAALPNLLLSNVPNLTNPSNTHNDPHHMLSYTSYIDPITKRKYQLAGGVISKNVFRWDVTDVRNIGIADIAVCGTQPKRSSLTDDFIVMPNGKIIFTYMGDIGYASLTGGTVTEINPLRDARPLLGIACNPLSVNDDPTDVNMYMEEYTARKNVPNVPRRAPGHDDLTRSGKNQGLFYLGNDNAGREAHPHGMQLTYDARYLVTSDYAVPVSIGVGIQLPGLLSDSTFGSSVRVWEVNPATLGPGEERGMKALADVDGDGSLIRSVSVVPDGPRQEPTFHYHHENEGLMAFGMAHQSFHCPAQAGWRRGVDGKFGTADDPVGGTGKNCAPAARIDHKWATTNSMCGGTMFYTPDITLPQSASSGNGPRWYPIYDVGPCSGVSYHSITDDDRFIIQPISGIQSPGDTEYERDYPREHSRRMLMVDIRPLVAKGPAAAILCNFPPRASDLGITRAADTTLGMLLTAPGLPAHFAGTSDAGPGGAKLNIRVHNNAASDCPRIASVVGEFETVLPIGATSTGNEIPYPGVGYIQLVGGIPNIITDVEAGGAPTAGGTGNLNTSQNLESHGGPHFTLNDRIGYQTTPGQGYANLTPDAFGDPRVPTTGVGRYGFIQYFVELNHVPGPGTGSDGDRTICMVNYNRRTGAMALDVTFDDEFTGQPCVDFDSAARASVDWAGPGRGVDGGAKPHSFAFERDGANLFGPGYLPPVPADGPL